MKRLPDLTLLALKGSPDDPRFLYVLSDEKFFIFDQYKIRGYDDLGELK